MKCLFFALLFFIPFSGQSQTLTTTDSIKIAMYTAGKHLKDYEQYMGAVACTEGLGIMIITIGYVASNNNDDKKTSKTNNILTTTYIGGGLCLLGGIMGWVAPTFVGKAGLSLTGRGVTWEIPHK